MTKESVHDVFIRETLEAFAYLRTDFEFEHSETKVVAYEAMVIFRKADRVAVTVACEAGGFPWVMLTGNIGTKRQYRSEELSVDVLLAARCPEEQITVPTVFPVDEAVVVEAVHHYASGLRRCATDVLEGDVGVFRELKARVDAEYKERAKQMRNEERVVKKRGHRRG